MERNQHDNNVDEQHESDKVPQIEYSIAPVGYKVERIDNKEWSDQGSEEDTHEHPHAHEQHAVSHHHGQYEAEEHQYEHQHVQKHDERYEDLPSASSVDGAYLYPTSSSELVAVESSVYPVMSEETSYESHNQRSASVFHEASGSVVAPISIGEPSDLHSPVHFDVDNYPQDVLQPAMMTLESAPRPVSETRREVSLTRNTNSATNREENQAENEEMNSTPTAHPDIRLQEVLKSSHETPVKNGICVQLNGQQLWRTFYDLGTEMIITKVGRRMFPAIRVKVKGLKSNRKYIMALDIEAVDDNRYRYVYHSSKWMVAGTADNPVPPRVFIHPESPQTGDSWMRQNSLVSFDKLKLTNNENDTHGHMILHSMHKYQPRIHVIEVMDDSVQPNLNFAQQIDTEAPGVTTFIFPETQFITVTAYQNQQITRLKIDRNPFAKGFRNSGRNNKSQYDQNAAPLPGTYAHHAASRLAYQSSSTGAKAAQEFSQGTMTTPVTWAQSVGVPQTAYSSDLSTHRKYAHHHHPAHQYPSIQSLSPNIQLAYADARYHESYSGYTLPTPAVGLQEDKQVEVTVLHQGAFRSGSNPAIHPHRQPSKRHLTHLPPVSDHYCKEGRYEDEYANQDSPTIQPTDPAHLHTPQTHLYFSQ